MTPEALAKQLKSETPPVIIDVRSGFEYKSGHIPGALHLPTSTLIFNRRQLPRDKQILLVITCEHGPRALLAKSVIGAFGYRNCELLEGHMHAYRRKSLPLEK
ncbi:MAG: rhodanese-like domain-containing protein [Geopsychrobacter sp.]|nr:rhodanese-like domain-containing protein [Geopsychrobacter sp.]